LSASWQLDLFGRLRRAEQAERFELAATIADRRATQHTVVAEVIRGRVAVATLQRRLAFAEDNVRSLDDTLRTVSDRYEAGVGNAVDLRLARENVRTASAQVPPLRRQLVVQQNALAVLTGRRSAAVEGLPDTLAELPELAPPPLALPAALLDQRPDVVASEFRARAQQSRIGVAIADLYPQFSVNAGIGFTADELDDIFDPESEVWNVLVQAAQPIFEGGRRRAAVEQAKATAEANAAQYYGLVLNALREVNDALVNESTARQELGFRVEALSEARAAEELAGRQYRQGLASLLTVFEAERRRRLAEEALVLAREQVWLGRVNLHLALGGDWGLDDAVDELTGTRASSDGNEPSTEAGAEATAALPQSNIPPSGALP
ncbi:MAG: efflux transporter outer membrane subunit, partial [Planctomycetota bacterium]